ncbi:MAG: SUMF1/EgtB/PvdO family nonheme iron enzyme [Armatimonadetes bacterium]|nr:SUMF1/EgtB/PvdO family nonheme iron enzyme [Armatimonadota bacterium]
MILIKGGTFKMGSESGLSDELPIHTVSVNSFYIDPHEVTNGQFAKFVSATHYVTTAERQPDPKDFPGVDPQDLKPGAGIFVEGKGWTYMPGANWQHPYGPETSIKGKDEYPVVQVSWDDAVAYAKWAGKQLPTEAEWEYAARSEGKPSEYVWGDQDYDDKKPQANIWQGQFPEKNDDTDGYKETAPVESFPPSPIGLYDMAGNVWEWTSDWYQPDYYKRSPKDNPQGPKSSTDPDEPNVPKRVMRGGSFLCAPDCCRGYRPSARMKSSPDTGLCHVGFRCVKSANP